MLLPLRFLVAAILLLEGYQKLMGGWLHGDSLYGTTQTWMDAHRAYDFFLPMLNSAHKHPKIFSALITLGELSVGLCLLLGVATRLAAFLGLLLMGSITAASGQGLAPPGNALLMCGILFTFLLAPPGRVVGLDASLRAKLPRWMA
ncbi:MAG TPA: DoxX family protein [Polyangia bacterium]|nr:DoxX family protein [Polyangia bacterium]